MYLKILLLSVILIAAAIAGIAIKMFFKKDGEFKKQCSTLDPETGKNLGCSCEGAPGDGSCRKEGEDHNHEKVSPVLAQIEQIELD